MLLEAGQPAMGQARRGKLQRRALTQSREVCGVVCGVCTTMTCSTAWSKTVASRQALAQVGTYISRSWSNTEEARVGDVPTTRYGGSHSYDHCFWELTRVKHEDSAPDRHLEASHDTMLAVAKTAPPT